MVKSMTLKNVQKRTVKCGKCGQRSPAGSAHNARTCGKTPTKQQYSKTKLDGVKASQVEFSQKNTPTTLSSRDVVNRWEEYNQKHTQTVNEDGQGNIALSVKTGERYTEEELVTLWTLEDGETGKLGKGRAKYLPSAHGWGWRPVWGENETKKLNSFVEYVEVQGPGAPPQVWWKFFKTFGAQAKNSFLALYADPAPVSASYRSDVFNEISLEQILAEAGLGDYPAEPTAGTLPINVIPAFLKDTSYVVRESVASLNDLPLPAAKFLTQDKKIEVIRSLVSGRNREGEVLQQAYDRLMEISAGGKTSTLKNDIRYELGYAHVTLAKHPNLPSHLQDEYLNNSQHYTDPHISSAIYQNPNLSPEKVAQVRENIKRKMKALDAQVADLEEKEGNTSSESFLLRSEQSSLRESYVNSIKYGYGTKTETLTYIRQKLLQKKGITGLSTDVGHAFKSETLTGEDLERFYYEVKKCNYNSSALAGIISNKNVPTSVLEDLCMSKLGEDKERHDYPGRLKFLEEIAQGIIVARSGKGKWHAGRKG